MAATDTFNWFLSTLAQVTPEFRHTLADQRSYLFSLRSEDERQRFVEQLMRDLNALLRQRPAGQRTS
jgi:hypothetical protein